MDRRMLNPKNTFDAKNRKKVSFFRRAGFGPCNLFLGNDFPGKNFSGFQGFSREILGKSRILEGRGDLWNPILFLMPGIVCDSETSKQSFYQKGWDRTLIMAFWGTIAGGYLLSKARRIFNISIVHKSPK